MPFWPIRTHITNSAGLKTANVWHQGGQQCTSWSYQPKTLFSLSICGHWKWSFWKATFLKICMYMWTRPYTLTACFTCDILLRFCFHVLVSRELYLCLPFCKWCIVLSFSLIPDTFRSEHKRLQGFDNTCLTGVSWPNKLPELPTKLPLIFTYLFLVSRSIFHNISFICVLCTSKMCLNYVYFYVFTFIYV